MICGDDQTHVKTAVELLNATRDIEMHLDKVSEIKDTLLVYHRQDTLTLVSSKLQVSLPKIERQISL